MEDRDAHSEAHAVEDDWCFPEEEERANSPKDESLTGECSRAEHEPVEPIISIEDGIRGIGQDICRNPQA